MIINTTLTFALFLGVFVGGMVVFWPDVPWAGLLAVSVVVMGGVPIAFYPRSKTTWLAIELSYHPLEPDERGGSRRPRSRFSQTLKVRSTLKCCLGGVDSRGDTMRTTELLDFVRRAGTERSTAKLFSELARFVTATFGAYRTSLYVASDHQLVPFVSEYGTGADDVAAFERWRRTVDWRPSFLDTLRSGVPAVLVRDPSTEVQAELLAAFDVMPFLALGLSSPETSSVSSSSKATPRPWSANTTTSSTSPPSSPSPSTTPAPSRASSPDAGRRRPSPPSRQPSPSPPTFTGSSPGWRGTPPSSPGSSGVPSSSSTIPETFSPP